MLTDRIIEKCHNNRVIQKSVHHAVLSTNTKFEQEAAARARLIKIALLPVLLCPVFVNGFAAIAEQSSKTNKLFGAVSSQNAKSDDALRLKIKNVFDSSGQLKQNLRGIIDEVTRQNYVTAMSPNVIGTTVIPSVPTQIPMGDYLPPRQQYMNFFATQTKSSIRRLAEADSTLVENENEDAVLSSQLAQAKSGVEKLQSENQKLQSMLSNSSYDNLGIGRQAVLMSDELDRVEKLLKRSEKRRKKVSAKN